MKRKTGLLSKFENSRIANDHAIRGGASDTMTYLYEETFVGKNGDIRHTCDTTLSDEVVIGYSFPPND